MGHVKLDKRFKYEAFGLNILSDFYLPHLISKNFDKPDVKIINSKFDLDLKQINQSDQNFYIDKQYIYRFWDFVGKFKINNNTIIVHPKLDVDNNILNKFILGTIFATLLRLRGLFVLHASAVNINGFAIAFSGFKGYGKSTTAMAFYNEGYPIISDDYIAIDFHNEIPMISQGFSCLKLSYKSAQYLYKNKVTNSFEKKRYFSVPRNYVAKKLPLKKIYFIERNECSKIYDITGQNAFVELIKNTFGINMFKNTELAINFLQCNKIFRTVNLSKFILSDNLNDLDKLVKLVEEDIL